VFTTGDEVISGLTSFCREQKLAGSHFTAIGAFLDAVIAYFDWEKKEYLRNPVREQVEVVSLVGDVALAPDGSPKVHAHVVLGRRNGTALGGHLMEAHVRPTLEVTLMETPVALQRRHDPQSGLAQIRL
jgi:predicted DNA-binding protein with PD1-like motif